MSASVATTQAFQERMFESIRDKMGDLLTDDDLKRIIEAAVQKGFFEERRVEGSYGRVQVQEAVFVKLVRDEVRAQAEKCIGNWLKENAPVVTAAIQECIGRGFTGIISNYLDSKAGYALNTFADQLKTQGLLR